MFSAATHGDPGENQPDSNHSQSEDNSASTVTIIAVVLSCIFVIAVVLIVMGIVCLSYSRRRPNFVVTQDNPKILMVPSTCTTTTSVPKSYVQSPRFTPKSYEDLSITEYTPVQPVIKKPIY